MFHFIRYERFETSNVNTHRSHILLWSAQKKDTEAYTTNVIIYNRKCFLTLVALVAFTDQC